MIDRKNCRLVGTITKTHGIKGEVVLRSDSGFPDNIEERELIFVEIDGGLVPFFVSAGGIRWKSNDALLVKFNDIDTEAQSAILMQCAAYIEGVEDELPDIEQSAIGFAVTMLSGEPMGTLREVVHLPMQDLLCIDFHGKEILIPLHESIVRSVDFEAQTIVVEPPDGLLDL